MLTPQEVGSKNFTKAVFGGYDMASVDEFLEALTKDYTDLYKENAALKNKMKVLVEKVEEYRATEDAMRMTLLTAQKMAKEMTDEAEKKSISLVENAERSSHDKIEALRAEVAAEEKKRDAAKQETATLIANIREMVTKHGLFLDKLDEYVPPVVEQPEPQQATTEEIEAEQERKADEIEKSVAQIIENAVGAEQEPVKKEPVSSDTKVYSLNENGEGRRTKFEFTDLKFGDDYDATK